MHVGYLAEVSVGGSPVLLLYSPTPRLQLDGLDPATVYEVRVMAVDSSGAASPWSPTIQFATPGAGG